MRSGEGRARALLLVAALLTTGAADAQTAPAPPSAGDAPGFPSAAPGRSEAVPPTAPLRTPSLRPTVTRPGSPTASPGPPPLTGAPQPALLPADVLRGVGGDASPLCRARCAPAFYACASGGGGDGACHLTLTTCRRACDAQALPAGRLQSPLPAAGLAPVGPLRPLPGALPPLQ